MKGCILACASADGHIRRSVGRGGVQSTGRSGIFGRELTRHLFYERPKP